MLEEGLSKHDNNYSIAKNFVFVIGLCFRIVFFQPSARRKFDNLIKKGVSLNFKLTLVYYANKSTFVNQVIKRRFLSLCGIILYSVSLLNRFFPSKERVPSDNPSYVCKMRLNIRQGERIVNPDTTRKSPP